MTKKELYTAIANGTTLTTEMMTFAQTLLDKELAANSAASAKRKENTAAKNAPLIDALRVAMSDGVTRTASEIVALGIEGIANTSKVTPIVNAIDGIVCGTTKIKGRTVKTYTLVV